MLTKITIHIVAISNRKILGTSHFFGEKPFIIA
jgi:hypothetical protein